MNGKSVRPANGALISPLRKHSSHLFIASFPDQLSVLFRGRLSGWTEISRQIATQQKIEVFFSPFIRADMKINEAFLNFEIQREQDRLSG